MLQKEIVQMASNIAKAQDEIANWEKEVIANAQSIQPTRKVTRPSRVQRGSVVFQGMASLIGEDPVSASEHDKDTVKELAKLKVSLKVTEDNLKQVEKDMERVVSLASKCRVWLGEGLPDKIAEKKTENGPGGSSVTSEASISVDELTDVREWLSDVQAIIESYQNVGLYCTF
jgi:predicted  nucleic acid-binding Zn-ribbon protein